MVILGLHFGHDASIAVVKDGRLLLCFERERRTRVKHVMTLTCEDIELCLGDVGLRLDDVDFCTLTSTQLVEYVLTDPATLSVELGRTPEHVFPCTLTDKVGAGDADLHARRSGSLYQMADQGSSHPYCKFLPDLPRYVAQKQLFGSFEHFIDLPLWSKAKTLAEIARTDYSPLMRSDDASHGFHYPAIATLRGRRIPSYIFSHHYAHLAYSFYDSEFDSAALLSHDGGGHGGAYGCGLFGYGRGNRIYPLTPHHLAAGEIYDFSGMRVGFDLAGAAGKLMGLSAYGKPRFFSQQFVGNWYDIGQLPPQAWIEHCEETARAMGYDLAGLGKLDRTTEPINTDFAASTQKLVEEIMLKACEALAALLRTAVGHVPNLCLSGGVALNCPANTRISQESSFTNVYIPPAVSDAGLSIGSAWALYHNMMGHPRGALVESTPRNAYLGLHGSATMPRIEAALQRYADRVLVQRLDDGPEQAAKDLADDKVIGWFEGRSEIGPRALGHRSLLANPTRAANWARVNRFKGRENWRPFAPAALATRTAAYFARTQMPSYFMLLNADVIADTLPAITHVDGSARVQSVTPDCGRFYEVLTAFDKLTGVPVVMNTSFNGPGEPIVETPDEAIAFMLESGFDAVYFGDIKVWAR